MSPFPQSPQSVEATLAEVGQRLAQLRLARNQTQVDLARTSGASISSIKRLEAGQNTSLDTFLRVLKAMSLENRLVDFLPDASVRPIERVKNAGSERRRAREKQSPEPSEWRWGDEA